MNQDLKEALVALAWMYEQYCGPNYGHDFMGAGEGAIEVLEKHGLGDEKKGIYEEKVLELEDEL